MTQDSIRKLIEIIEQTEDKIKVETNENAKKFYWDIIEGISEVLMNEGFCPECGEELIAKGIHQYIGDYQGTSAYEDVEVYVCKNGHIRAKNSHKTVITKFNTLPYPLNGTF